MNRTRISKRRSLLGRRVVELAPEDLNSKIYLARSFVHYGDSIPEAEMPRKMETFRGALAIADEVIATAPDDETANRILASATHRVQLYTFLAAAEARKKGDPGKQTALLREALEVAKRSTAAQQKVLSLKPDNPVYRRNVAGGTLNEGTIYRELGETETAIRLAREALDTQLAIAAADSSNQEIKLDLKESYEDLALAHIRRGELAAARIDFEKAIALNDELLKKDPQNFDFLDREAARRTGLRRRSGRKGFKPRGPRGLSESAQTCRNRNSGQVRRLCRGFPHEDRRESAEMKISADGV
ncbi:MAG: tetratricopeptide repeat protein [Acidobacteria bacterium]|nr:tetratricopeptide repeat protein [Acidobacteriota bacterium]